MLTSCICHTNMKSLSWQGSSTPDGRSRIQISSFSLLHYFRLLSISACSKLDCRHVHALGQMNHSFFFSLSGCLFPSTHQCSSRALPPKTLFKLCVWLSPSCLILSSLQKHHHHFPLLNALHIPVASVSLWVFALPSLQFSWHCGLKSRKFNSFNVLYFLIKSLCP